MERRGGTGAQEQDLTMSDCVIISESNMDS